MKSWRVSSPLQCRHTWQLFCHGPSKKTKVSQIVVSILLIIAYNSVLPFCAVRDTFRWWGLSYRVVWRFRWCTCWPLKPETPAGHLGPTESFVPLWQTEKAVSEFSSSKTLWRCDLPFRLQSCRGAIRRRPTKMYVGCHLRHYRSRIEYRFPHRDFPSVMFAMYVLDTYYYFISKF